MSRLREMYKKEVVPALTRQFGYGNIMAVPAWSKSMSTWESASDRQRQDPRLRRRRTGIDHRPASRVTKPKKSIAAFKLRQGMPIGVTVTLRGDRMFEFFDRLVNMALPRVRDFRGVSARSFDGRGNYTLGLRDQLIFPRSITGKSTRPAHEHHFCHHGRPRMMKPMPCCSRWHAFAKRNNSLRHRAGRGPPRSLVARTCLKAKARKHRNSRCALTSAVCAAAVPVESTGNSSSAICFRNLALSGEIPGVTKSSW